MTAAFLALLAAVLVLLGARANRAALRHVERQEAYVAGGLATRAAEIGYGEARRKARRALRTASCCHVLTGVVILGCLVVAGVAS